MGLIELVARQQDGGHSGPPLDPAFAAETRAPAMIAGNALVQAVGCLFFIMRAYSRIAIIKTWRMEDYILAAGWLCSTAYSICQYGQIHHGAGRHLIAIIQNNASDPVESQKYAYVAQIVLFPGLALPKISICCAYLRIFYTDKLGQRLIQALMVYLVLATFPFSIEVMLQCKPIHAYWTEGRPPAKCVNDIVGFYLSGAMNVTADVALMAIVLPRVLELQLHKRQRWALVGIVSLGTLAIFAGLARMIRVGTMLLSKDFDPSWDSYDVSIWTSTELYITLICASAAGIKPFIAKILPKLLGSSLLSHTRATGLSNAYEMGSRWKRPSMGHSHIQRQASETAFAAAQGPYTECGRGVDAQSLGGKTNSGSGRRDSDDDVGIYKTSEIRVQTSKREP